MDSSDLSVGYQKDPEGVVGKSIALQDCSSLQPETQEELKLKDFKFYLPFETPGYIVAAFPSFTLLIFGLYWASFPPSPTGESFNSYMYQFADGEYPNIDIPLAHFTAYRSEFSTNSQKVLYLAEKLTGHYRD
ncbi:hypothetical protein DSO57_1026659 [Entomophthora muscae]|uniref:Uncharacterized protein n=1 Tax=Entomophthora muscae TaxID=34485 RepID=A0ACC2S3X9_9FUNG|nr:hypothetical protein DSO57_1026659 [Entomophthora muscae]